MRIPVLVATLLMSFSVHAERVTVVDGDTVRNSEGVSVRILGIDTPELHSTCRGVDEHDTFRLRAAEHALAARARDRMAELTSGDVTIHYQMMTTRAGVYQRKLDKYGRLLAEVRDDHARNLADVLVREGLAVRYDGGRRIGWCGR